MIRQISPASPSDLLARTVLWKGATHTVGPMKAAATFVRGLRQGRGESVARIEATVFGSSAWTDRGHSTDKAIVLGLSGKTPDRIDPDEASRLLIRFAKIVRSSSRTAARLSSNLTRTSSSTGSAQFDRHPNAMDQGVGCKRRRRLVRDLVFQWRWLY